MIEEIDRDKLREEIKDSISRQWEVQARAAGWSPPISSKLRVVEKCNGVNHKMGMNPYDKDCLLCDNKGTIKRDLKPEELVVCRSSL
jgi:hypothetical protein